MSNEISRVAFRGMCTDDPEVMQICLAKIWHMATKGIGEEDVCFLPEQTDYSILGRDVQD